MSKSVTAFAPGKVILTGEHSVVFGNLALLASLDLGVSCSVMAGELTLEQQNDGYLQLLLRIAARELGKEDLSVVLKIESKLPVKSGLGSSAALAAAILKAVMNFFGKELSKPELFKLVSEAENFIHGQSSGADPAIVVYGGILAFKERISTPFQAKILGEQSFFLVNSGAASESTGEMVDLVKNKAESKAVVAEIAEVSLKMFENLQKNIWQPELFDQNQFLLDELGVVGDSAREIIAKLQSLRAHCKITGAGGVKSGSGYILATHSDPAFFAKKMKEISLDFFAAKLGQTERGLNEIS